MIKKLIISICISLLTGCTTYSINDDKDTIEISSININLEYSISSINDSVIGIVMFSEYGRPDQNNAIIGAHSGYGPNAYFNDLDKLESGDLIKLIYDGVTYKYLVSEVFEVDDTSIEVLDSSYEGLILITCKVGDDSKRIVVKASIFDK